MDFIDAKDSIDAIDYFYGMPHWLRSLLHRTIHFIANPRNAKRQASGRQMYSINL